MEKATFAAGRFQGAAAAFRAVPGVRAARAGHTEGEPVYEAVEVEYDPWKASYDDLLEVFWRKSDPEQPAAIYAHTVEQHAAALDSRDRAPERSATEIGPCPRFRPAEDER